MLKWKNKLKVSLYKALATRRKLSFSQCGEDKYVDHLLSHVKKGFYLDIGAFHPVNISNTYLFYLKGWNGINIEPTPGKITDFNRFRPKDINLNIAVGP